jgi:transposase
MPSRVIHRKPNGVAYVYSVESYWDKDKKAPRNRQVCLGRLDETTGEVIPSKRAKKANQTDRLTEHHPDLLASVRVSGPNTLLSALDASIGLSKTLRRCAPDICDAIMSLVYFIIQKGHPLSRSEFWSQSHDHPWGRTLTSQQVSRILQQLSADQRERFLHLWTKQLTEFDYLCYDITSVSSYAKSNEYVQGGYNRDKEPLEQINLAMLYGQNSGLPAYYRRLPGNISDVSTLRTTLSLLEPVKSTNAVLVLDRGFYSERNIKVLVEEQFRFIAAVPSNRNWVKAIIAKLFDDVVTPKHYRQTGENEALYMTSHPHTIGKHQCYLHLYFNAIRQAEDIDALTRRIIRMKEELESGKRKTANERFYERFFIITESETGFIVSYNDDAIRDYRDMYAGFFAIMTNEVMDSGELLDIYRRKDIVENCFDDLKNSLDMRRLRVHSSPAMDSRLFIQFLALILISKLRLLTRDVPELKYLSIREVMEAMECVTQVSVSDSNVSVTTELGPLQRILLKLADAITPT